MKDISKKIVLIAIGIILFLLSYIYYLAGKQNLLALSRIRAVVIVAFLLMIGLTIFLVKRKKYNRYSAALLIVLLLGHIFVFSKVYSAVNFFDSVNENAKQSINVVKIYTLKESEIATYEDLINCKIYALENDRLDVEVMLAERQLKLEVSFRDFQEDIYESLLNGQVEAIVLTSKSESLFGLVHDNMADQLKEIVQYSIVQTITDSSAQNEDVDPVEEPDKIKSFNIYISGIDSYGDINTVSRSDVNIIASVNLEKGKVILISTPRDAYVKIADGGQDQYDKLTHAGVYGVNASLHTLENLYDSNIDFFVRINFTSFLNVIDAIGGIDVYNDQAFVSLHGGDYFPIGQVHMNAKEALGYVRERFALKNGDLDRSRNQEKVIKAVIEKMLQKENLLNADRIFRLVSQSIQTNVSFEQAMGWVDYQLESNKSIEIEKVVVEGRGQSGLPSYAMPGYNLYMYVIDEQNLAEIKQKINQLLD